jgi:ADP-ribose pyrophosphatase YjhB (NUDIX family)
MRASGRIGFLRSWITNHLLDLAHHARMLVRRWRKPIILDVRGMIFHHGRVLLVRHSYGNRSWSFPGGVVDRGETLADAMRREAREELNADIHIERLHGMYDNFKHGASEHIAVFVASLKEPTDLKPSWEIAAFDFFDPHALPEATSPATRRRIEEYLRDDRAIQPRSW